MISRFFILVVLIAGFNCCCSHKNNIAKVTPLQYSITKLEMNLSAFGVESDDFPSIEVYVNFTNDSSNCKKSFYNPANKASVYSLSKNEIQQLREILMKTDLEKLKQEYTVQKTDQATSITTIYTTLKKITIKDYGLEGNYPMKELYKIVYKF